MNEQTPLVSMKGITKTFGTVTANRNVDLDFMSGEVHALLGENGAGKSTLMNMLSGVYTPDSGSISINGKPVRFSTPKDAIDHGIGMIYQHFRLVEAMTALENIMLGREKRLFFRPRDNYSQIMEVAGRFGLEVDLNKRVYEMSVGEKQILAILQVLYRGARILVLDEPTTVFTPQETKNLFQIINRMKDAGCSIIFISHKMDEVMEISDSITVLRKGEKIKTLRKEDTNPGELADLMVGRAVELSIPRVAVEPGDAVLRITGLHVFNDNEVEVLKNVSLEVRAGEVLGIAGIANSGQRELCEAIVGMQPVAAGQIVFRGEDITGRLTREIVEKGISLSFIPEDRLGMGLVASMDMVDNMLLKTYHKQPRMLLDRKSVVDECLAVIDKLEVMTPGVNHPIRDLSGGNIQKILLGRELNSSPRLLIMAYPTRGLDVHTCHIIYELINEQKQLGVGVIYIGEELDVLMELSDRIAVISRGELTGTVSASDVTREQLGLMMMGQMLEEAETA